MIWYLIVIVSSLHLVWIFSSIFLPPFLSLFSWDWGEGNRVKVSFFLKFVRRKFYLLCRKIFLKAVHNIIYWWKPREEVLLEDYSNYNNQGKIKRNCDWQWVCKQKKIQNKYRDKQNWSDELFLWVMKRLWFVWFFGWVIFATTFKTYRKVWCQ